MQNLQQPQEVNPLFIHARWSFGNDEKALGNYANHPAGEGKWGMPKDLQSPPQGAKMGAVLNYCLSGNHDEDRCLLVAVADWSHMAGSVLFKVRMSTNE